LRAHLGERLEVGARAEREIPSSGQDQGASILVGLEGTEALEQLLGGLGVDGITALRPLDRQQGR